MRGRDWPWFSQLHLWQKLSIGLVFGVALAILLLLPGRLGERIGIAGFLVTFVSLFVGYRVGLLLLFRFTDREDIGRLALAVAAASAVSAGAVFAVALVWHVSWVLWFLMGSIGLGEVAYLFFLLKHSMPQRDGRLS